jgi:hypothetical protein
MASVTGTLGVGVHSPGRSDAGTATDETKTRYKTHGDPRCRCGRKIDGQDWLELNGVMEACCEPRASAFGDPRITPRSNRRIRVS